MVLISRTRCRRVIAAGYRRIFEQNGGSYYAICLGIMSLAKVVALRKKEREGFRTKDLVKKGSSAKKVVMLLLMAYFYCFD